MHSVCALYFGTRVMELHSPGYPKTRQIGNQLVERTPNLKFRQLAVRKPGNQ